MALPTVGWVRAGLAMLLAAGSASCTIDGSVGENDPRDVDGDGVPFTEDCDDEDPLVNPELPEWCDGRDNDCDGTPDLAGCTEVLEVSQQMRLDLLLVLDDTPSMEDDLVALADGMDDLLPSVVDTEPSTVSTPPSRDTHLGVIVMDADDEEHGGRLISHSGRRFASATMSRDAVHVWIDGQLVSIAEEASQIGDVDFDSPGLDVAEAALFAGHLENTNFRRPDAHLALLFASDTDNVGAALSALDFLSSLQAGGIGDVTAHAVVSTDDTCPDFVGETYLQLAQLTGGLTQSICADNYGPFLSALGQVSAQNGLRDTFTLDSPAQPGSIGVSYEIVGGLVVSIPRSEVVLVDPVTVQLVGAPPPVGSKIRITWQRLESPPSGLDAD